MEAPVVMYNIKQFGYNSKGTVAMTMVNTVTNESE